MKKGLLIRSPWDESWAGGKYYINNFIFLISQNDYICRNYKIVIFAKSNNFSASLKLSGETNIIKTRSKKRIAKLLELLISISIKQVAAIYPSSKMGNKAAVITSLLGVNTIHWIPDFQHNQISEAFTHEELNSRTLHFKNIANSRPPLVLSSHDCLNDFRRFYSTTKQNVYVVPFVSYIEPETLSLTPKLEKDILSKYDLTSPYVCVSNQFWKHKNHIAVLQAIKQLTEKHPDFHLQFVFTGYPKDYRDPDYFDNLMKLFDDPILKPQVKILGFIDRLDQIAIIKNAKFIIQPSLFEGWGTVVEDAKVLDKLILLSDIPIHHEQMNENCTLFDPHNPEELAEKIIQLTQLNHVDDIEKGIADMYARAKEYSKGFEQLLKDCEAQRAERSIIQRLRRKIMKAFTPPRKIADKVANKLASSIAKNLKKDETKELALGKLLSYQQRLLPDGKFNDHEFKIFSQWGDDGLIQYLTRNLRIENKMFIEFGVENYSESNTRFLMMNDNWTGFVMDGSEAHMATLCSQPYYWKYGLNCKAIFITKDNINRLLRETGFKNVGILSIDIDGNDAHIFDEIDLAELNPSIVISEYNAVFGAERPISTPYDPGFVRSEKHYSNLYYGASLSALTYIANKKGYALIGCNTAGNNAYFVRKDLLNERITEKPVLEAFEESKFREGRDKDGRLTYLDGKARYDLIKGLPVVNIITSEEEQL